MSNQINKAIKKKIYEKWIPKLEEHYSEKGYKVSRKKLEKIAELAHTRNIFEGYATTGNVNGRGAFSFGNNPSVAGDTAKGSGEVFQNLFTIFLDAAATTPGMDLVPFLTMSKSNITVFLAEPIYANGKLSSATNKPEMFQVPIVKTGSPNALVVGNTYIVKTANSGGENIMDLIYVGVERVKGDAIFRFSRAYDNSGSSGTDFTGLTIKAALETSGAAIYTSGVAYFSFTTAKIDSVNAFNNVVTGYVGAGMNDDTPWYANRAKANLYNSPMSREVGEKTPSRSMGIRTLSQNFSARTFDVDIEYTIEQIQDAKMDHDTDLIELGDQILQDQLSQALNEYILGHIHAWGWSHHYNMSLGGFNMNLVLDTNNGNAQTWYGKDSTQLTISAAAGAIPNSGAVTENLSTMQRRIISRMLYGSGVVKNRCRKGKGDTSVMNTTFTSAIKDVRGYTPTPFQNSLNDSDLFMVGDFYGISVYEDGLADMTDPRISIFRKGNDNDPGLKLCTYLLAEKISTIAEGTMAPKQLLKSRLTIADCGSAPELNYLDFVVEQGAGYSVI
jgi:hypothetical protein